MLNSRSLLHRASVVLVLVGLTAVAMTGCSTVSPDSSWSGNEGSLDGEVRSTQGALLAGIDLTIRAQASEGDWFEYQATTDSSGAYRIQGIDLGQSHAFEKEYTVYVNRTHSSSLPIVTNYGTHSGTVLITVDGATYDASIVQDGPGVPDSYVE